MPKSEITSAQDTGVHLDVQEKMHGAFAEHEDTLSKTHASKAEHHRKMQKHLRGAMKRGLVSESAFKKASAKRG